jgi:NAD-dependent deacetylase
LTILTGAGVSAASGVPTFRGADGLWRNFRPEELATPAAFRRNPSLVWEWYHWRRERIAQCHPNSAHDVIAGWSVRDGSSVLTQNVDDLHIRAGTRRLVRLHGSIWELKCWDDCGQPVWRDEQSWPGDTSQSDRTATDGVHHCPRCPRCGGLARPAVVWFGESLNPADVETALAACDCDMFLTIGTSSIVHPAAGFVHEAARRGAFTVEINPDQTPASDLVDLVIRAAAEDILPALASA